MTVDVEARVTQFVGPVPRPGATYMGRGQLTVDGGPIEIETRAEGEEAPMIVRLENGRDAGGFAEPYMAITVDVVLKTCDGHVIAEPREFELFNVRGGPRWPCSRGVIDETTGTWGISVTAVPGARRPTRDAIQHATDFQRGTTETA